MYGDPIILTTAVVVHIAGIMNTHNVRTKVIHAPHSLYPTVKTLMVRMFNIKADMHVRKACLYLNIILGIHKKMVSRDAQHTG